MKLLAIESSCDETAAAVVEDGRKVLSSVIYSQIEEHKIYGGVVSEIASRRHTEQIVSVVQSALEKAQCAKEDIDAIAVTAAPGLIGAVLVGVNFAKGLALAWNKPLVPVHHLRGHIAANYLAHGQLEPPFFCLVASGGHSHIVHVKSYTEFEVLGRTCDDAAGEAYDKAARAMGLGYPGGVALDKLAQSGDKGKYKLPEPKVRDSLYDFSFSGLKTAVVNLIRNAQQKGEEVDIPSLAAAFQERVCHALCKNFIQAATDHGCKKIALAGGVAANSRLREMVAQAAEQNKMELYIPPISLCGDNAAMIGAQGYYEYMAGNTFDQSLNGKATMEMEASFR